MHAPDGFLNAGTALATGAVSAGTLGVAARQAKERLSNKAVPLAGMAAAFVFAAQMFNFPVAAGTTGHLLGGALVAILLGPSMGALVVAIVVVVQALGFADGGITALGYNVLNMAIIPSFGGYAVFRLLRKVVPKNRRGVVVATGLAAWASVVMAAMGFSIEWLFGASVPVPFDTVFLAMVGVHALIGVGEAVISAAAVGVVLSVRPDLVHGAVDLNPEDLSDRRRVGLRVFVLAGLLAAVVFAVGVSQFSVEQPDGLETVSADAGITGSSGGSPLESGWFAHYATAGIDNEELSLAVAGITGVAVTLAVSAGVFLALRERADRRRGA